MHAAAGPSDAEHRTLIEGIARVVAVENGVAWLEPEQTAACGSCHAASACGAKPGSARLVARRFSLPDDHGLRVGERVVVGTPEASVRRAALTAYGLPLLFMLVAGVTVQKMGGGDLEAALATLGGLAAGLGMVRLQSLRFAKRGEYAPQYLRRAAGPDAGCADRC